MTHVYIAAPFREYLEAEKLQAMLQGAGYYVNSRWLRLARQFSGVEPAQDFQLARAAIRTNDSDVECCDALVAMLYPGLGREMFAEARYAATLHKPVFWFTGTLPSASLPPLSAYRPDNFVVETYKGLVEELGAWFR